MKQSARYNYILLAYLTGIVFFTLFRLACTLVWCISQPSWPDFNGMYGKALFMGWRFDTAVSCYLLALPALMMIVGELARIRAKAYYLTAHHLLVIGYIVSFFACTADIPFFSYFFTRLNATAVNEVDSLGIILHMIVTEPMYLAGIGAFIIVATGYWFLMRYIFAVLLPMGTTVSNRMGGAFHWRCCLSLPLLLACADGSARKARCVSAQHTFVLTRS